MCDLRPGCWGSDSNLHENSRNAREVIYSLSGPQYLSSGPRVELARAVLLPNLPTSLAVPTNSFVVG